VNREEPTRVLLADPPWPFRDRLPGKTRGAAKQYPCLSVSDLARFPLPPLADDCWLALWYVTSMVEEARFVCRAWGFQPTGGEIVWVKTTDSAPLVCNPSMSPPWPVDLDAEVYDLLNGGHPCSTKLAFGMGRTVRNCDERILIARRGRPKLGSRSVRSVFFASQPRLPNGKVWHSAKPDRSYEVIEALCGEGPRVELFARREREGWTCLGHGMEADNAE
jgi:N6-adenosine-specific RNA methylase IME4